MSIDYPISWNFDKNYNSQEEVQAYVTNLDRLHEVIEARTKMYKDGRFKFGESFRLKEISLFRDAIRLDSCSNIWIKESENSHRASRKIPTEETKCIYCGDKFSVYKLDSDCICKTKPLSDHDEFVHKECNLFMNLTAQESEFLGIFKQVYPDITHSSFKPIPNRYCPCHICSPWFIVDTPTGNIKIGWRKRVISIEWLGLKGIDTIFPGENVTKWENGIHAWGNEKCVEYLRTVRDFKGTNNGS